MDSEDKEKVDMFKKALTDAKQQEHNTNSPGSSWIYPYGGCPYCRHQCPCCGRPLGWYNPYPGPYITWTTGGYSNATGCSCK